MDQALPRLFNADDFLKTVSTKPGIYIMRDDKERIIYVGKAKNLKNRLSSYFKTKQLAPKTAALVANIASIETTITEKENEALLLECNLIKKYRPRYNVSLIDDKSYPYIHLSRHQFPRFSFYRGIRKRQGEYFGPYPSSGAVKETLNLMKRVFKVRQCDDIFFSHRTRPCLQYQIDRCSGPCVGKISHDAYIEAVEAARLFLQGKSHELIQNLGRKMLALSEEMKFEGAAMIRDQIRHVSEIQGSNIIEKGRGALDVMALYQESDITVVEVMTIRDGRVLGTRAYFPQVPKDTEMTEVLSSFIAQYYGAHRLPPATILINVAFNDEEQSWLENALTELLEKRVTLQSNVRQQKKKWLTMSLDNAKQSLKVKLAGKSTIEHRLSELRLLLGMKKPITRIDCFDISHSFGERTVASNVVYMTQGFDKKYYRRFNIEGITAGDDYAAMKQALTRRFRKKEEETYPDILLIDGGKGQLHVAIDVLAELGIDQIFLMSISEGEGKVSGQDKLWLADMTTIDIDRTSSAFHLLVHIRDEAHRFAIEGHRGQRDKLRRRSVLEDIPGIGKMRRTALLAHFGGLETLKKASVDDIAKVSGIDFILAKKVYEVLHKSH